MVHLYSAFFMWICSKALYNDQVTPSGPEAFTKSGQCMLVLILPTPEGWKAEWTLAGKEVTQIFDPRPGRGWNQGPQDWEAEIFSSAPTPLLRQISRILRFAMLNRMKIRRRQQIFLLPSLKMATTEEIMPENVISTKTTYEWPWVTTNDREWPWESASDHEWPRMTISDHE